MMELRRHIEILLLSNDCVIVPHLGGFMAHHIEARYDSTDGMLIPPLRTLGFNPQLSMSDSLLAQSYMDAYDISFPEAVKRIESEVHLLKQRLETEGSIDLPDLGTLRVTPEGHYAFDPCSSGILTPSLYGFGAVEMPHLSNLKRQASAPLRTIELPTQPFGIIEPASARRTSKLATIMSHIDQRETPEEEKTISIKVSLLRNLAVTAVAAVALLLFARPVPQGESDVETAAQEASVMAVPEVSETEAPQLESILSSLESVSQKIKISNEEGVVPEAGSYTIVLAYSLPLENAKQFLADIKAKGARKAVLMTYKSENVIVYGSYATNSEAYSHLQELQANGSVSSGWIMQMN